MNVLLIGGAGYIGSHVAWSLHEAGHTITVFDNFSTGDRRNLFQAERCIEGDILDYPALAGAMRGGFDALIHLAALKAAGESMTAPEKYSQTNLCGTIHILNAAAEAGIKRMVFSSSAAVYGEPEYLPIDENHPLNPENYYGFTKLEIERMLVWYERIRGLRYAVLRYFNAAGYDIKGRVSGLERNPANLLPVVMEAAAGMRPAITVFGDDYPTPDGSCIRDYIHVNDLALAHTNALDYITKNDTSITLNLGSETGISVFEMLETARKITGVPFKSVTGARRAGDPARLTASARRAKELLGWEARYSDPETLIRTTWDLYRRHL